MKTFCETVIGLEESIGKKLNTGLVEFDKQVKPNRGMYNLYELICKFKFKTKKDLLNRVEKEKLQIKGTYMVRVNRTGNRIKSKVLEKEIGALIHNSYNSVNFKDPDTKIVGFVINDSFILGKLIYEKPKDYLLKRHSASMTTVVAYTVLKTIGLKPKDKLINLFCKDGVFTIESKLLENEVLGIDKEYNVKSSIVNSKLAGVDPKIFKAIEIDWVDTRLDGGYYDKSISVLPSISKVNRELYIKKIIEKYIDANIHLLKKDGLMCVVVSKPNLFKKLASKKFKLISEHGFNKGEQSWSVLVFRQN